MCMQMHACLKGLRESRAPDKHGPEHMQESCCLNLFCQKLAWLSLPKVWVVSDL